MEEFVWDEKRIKEHCHFIDTLLSDKCVRERNEFLFGNFYLELDTVPSKPEVIETKQTIKRSQYVM